MSDKVLDEYCHVFADFLEIQNKIRYNTQINEDAIRNGGIKTKAIKSIISALLIICSIRRQSMKILQYTSSLYNVLIENLFIFLAKNEK